MSSFELRRIACCTTCSAVTAPSTTTATAAPSAAAYRRSPASPTSLQMAQTRVRLEPPPHQTRCPLPPGPPSSSSSDATKSSKASQSSAAGTRPAPPPPTWAELDAYYIAEMAATSATEQRAVWDPSSTAGAPSSQLEALNFELGRPAVPPPSWAELAYRRHYAKLAAKSATEQGVPPGAQSTTAGNSAAPPLTWAEFNDALRKTKSCYDNAYRQPTEVAPAIARAEASQQPQGQDGEQ